VGPRHRSRGTGGLDAEGDRGGELREPKPYTGSFAAKAPRNSHRQNAMKERLLDKRYGRFSCLVGEAIAHSPSVENIANTGGQSPQVEAART
jgi:hypothetical protein